MPRPAPLALVAALSIATISCGQAAPVEPEAFADRYGLAQPVTIKRLRSEPYPLSYTSGIRVPQRSVIRGEAEWRDSWAAIWRGHSPTPPLPTVDFAREMLVLVALGERNSGGYSILIDSAAARGSGGVVWVRTIRPGWRCVTTAALTQPVDAALLPRIEGEIEFREHAEVVDCR